MEFVEVNILFFAKSRDLVGVPKARVKVHSSLSTSQLRQEIVSHFPSLKSIENNFLIALNEEYLDSDDKIDLKSDDEIAIIPPISGG